MTHQLINTDDLREIYNTLKKVKADSSHYTAVHAAKQAIVRLPHIPDKDTVRWHFDVLSICYGGYFQDEEMPAVVEEFMKGFKEGQALNPANPEHDAMKRVHQLGFRYGFLGYKEPVTMNIDKYGEPLERK